MARHIDDYDDEVQEQKRIHLGFNFNFKSMYIKIGQVVDAKGDKDDHYPKDGLIKYWGCAMFVLFILFVFSHSLFLVATCPFIFFYAFVVFQVFKAMKVFEDKRWPLLIATLVLLPLEAVGAYYLQQLIFFS